VAAKALKSLRRYSFVQIYVENNPPSISEHWPTGPLSLTDSQ
jgi:hypothetical protein